MIASLLLRLIAFTPLFPPFLSGWGLHPAPPKASKARPRETAEVLRVIQKNADLMTKALWSSAVIVHARYKDEKGHHHSYNLEGSMLFRKPRDLRMDLRPGIGDRVMEIGSNSEEYWIWIDPEMHMMRWGRHRFAGTRCAEPISVRPDQLPSLLTLEGMPSDMSGPERQKKSSQFDVLIYTRKGAQDGWETTRKYYVDRSPPYLIRMVNAYDQKNRLVMSAYLEDFRPAWQGGPLIAHQYSVKWPLDDARFTMEVVKFDGRTQVSPNAFVRPTAGQGLPNSVTDIRQVDEDCK